MNDQVQSQAPQTTGHVWDGDLQEYNNPLPAWWVWAFYATVVFALIYWVLYPAWPLGNGFTKGMDTITYVNNLGQTKTVPWNTRALLMKEMNKAAAAQKPYFAKVMATPYAQIVHDPELSNFVLSAGRSLFLNNCAACHQSGGQGLHGLSANLTDDYWLYGGTFAKIQQTITYGRHGYMPPFRDVLSGTQIGDLANYVVSLSGQPADPAAAKTGDVLFHSETAACYYCHGAAAKGRSVIGSANLTAPVSWIWTAYKSSNTPAENVAAVAHTIEGGVYKGVMPTWKDRLTPVQIKVLTAYVHELGGGQ